MESNVIQSASIKIRPQDDRCKYWCKIIRAGAAIPVPADVAGANNVPGAFARRGDDELFSGDVVIEGEEKHHRHARGWMYTIGAMGADGTVTYIEPNAAVKSAIKAAGLIPAAMLAGSGELAACIRVTHALHAGMTIDGLRAAY